MGSVRSAYRVVQRPRPFRAFLDALDELTRGDDDFDRFVHRQLAEPTRVPKRNVLVLHAGEPVLATTLRLRAHFWEPATTTCMPYLRLPHRPGQLEAALSAAQHEVLIPEYFGDIAEFRRSEITHVEVYTMPLQEKEFRSYWSENTWRSVVKARNRTRDLRVALDDPDALEWVVARWVMNWEHSASDEIGVADDLRAIWPEMLARRRLRTLTLYNGDVPVASSTMGVHGSTVIGLVTARDKTWTRGALGIRVFAESLEAMRGAGFERLESGGYHEYKRRFAPPGGTHPLVHIRPGLQGRVEAKVRRLRFLGGRAVRRLRAG